MRACRIEAITLLSDKPAHHPPSTYDAVSAPAINRPPAAPYRVSQLAGPAGSLESPGAMSLPGLALRGRAQSAACGVWCVRVKCRYGDQADFASRIAFGTSVTNTRTAFVLGPVTSHRARTMVWQLMSLDSLAPPHFISGQKEFACER